MRKSRLLDDFERLSDSPETILRLRRFILDLAVRGRLVPQDPAEAAADIVPRGSALEISRIESPPGWLTTKVGSVVEFMYGKALPAAARSIHGTIPVYGSNGIVGKTVRPLIEVPAVIVGRKGSAGALNLSLGSSWTTDVAYYVIPPPAVAVRYLFLALQTLDLDGLGKGVKPGLSRRDVYDLPFSVPPLAEQHRIVTRVHNLMTVCDELSAAQVVRERLTRRTLEAVLHAELPARGE